MVIQWHIVLAPGRQGALPRNPGATDLTNPPRDHEERKMTTRMNRMLGWLTLAMLALASPALADSHDDASKKGGTPSAASDKKEPTPEQRAEMADTHQRMADCLRSTRPFKECRAEMKKSCKHCQHMGDGGGKECSMDHQGHGSGKHKKTPPAPAPAPAPAPSVE